MTKRAAGSGTIRKSGHIAHYRNGKIVFAHVEIAERALGHKLPRGAQVHHVNRDPADNTPTNLVICPSQSYHKLLHVRMNAHDACGNPNWRMCGFCKTYDDVERQTRGPEGGYWHPECRNRYMRDRYHRRK